MGSLGTSLVWADGAGRGSSEAATEPVIVSVCRGWAPDGLIKTGFPGGSEGQVSACKAGDPGSIPGSGRSPGEGNGNPLQYSCLENPMDGEAWWATVHRVAEGRTRLSDFTSLFTELSGQT